MIEIELPFPRPNLSPNKRLHWRALAAAKKAYEYDCFYAAYAVVGRDIKLPKEPIRVSITFIAPDRRQRDRDNIIASFKAGQDGLAKALGLDDKWFRQEYHFGEPEKPGRVIVRVG